MHHWSFTLTKPCAFSHASDKACCNAGVRAMFQKLLLLTACWIAVFRATPKSSCFEFQWDPMQKNNFSMTRPLKGVYNYRLRTSTPRTLMSTPGTALAPAG